MKKILLASSIMMLSLLSISGCQQQNPPVEKPKSIAITTPQPNQTVSNPINIEGKATLWFFEGEFPITIQDENGNTLAATQAKPLSDWMTEEPVPFTAQLQLTEQPQDGTKGTIIFTKSNPSGIAELDETYELPVTF